MAADAATTSMFLQLGILLFSAVILGKITKKLGLSSVFGYLLAGLLLGPNMFGIVSSSEIQKYLSELGMVLLLFYMGLEVSIKKFSKSGIYSLMISPVKSSIGFLLGFTLGKILGFPFAVNFALGAAFAVSSTAITAQLIIEKGWERDKEAHIALGMQILEDIYSVFIIAYLLGATTGVPVGKLVLNSITFAFILLAIGPRLSKRVLRFFDKFVSKENFAVLATSLILIVAYSASYIGMSPLIAAFFLGMILSETVHAKRLEQELASLRNMFVLIFFTSLGVAYHVTFSTTSLLVAAIGLFLLVVPVYSVNIVGTLGGLKPKSIAKIQVLMTPLGEFSLFFLSMLQMLDFTNPNVLKYFGMTAEQAGIVPVLSSELLGAFYIIIFVTTLIAAYFSNRLETLEKVVEKSTPKIIKRVAEVSQSVLQVHAAHDSLLGNPVLGALFEKKVQKLLEYLAVIFAVAYLTGYAATEYPESAGTIFVIGMLVIIYPLYSIVRETYAGISRYVETMINAPKHVQKHTARGIGYMLLSLVFFAAGFVMLAFAEGFEIITLFVTSAAFLAAASALMGVGIYRMLKAAEQHTPGRISA